MNPRLVVWDFNKEINVTLEDALISLESLKFMLGGAIHKPTSTKPTIVRHTEEVVCGEDGKVPKPIEHLSKVEMTPTASENHPIRVINLTTGVRCQLEYAAGNESNAIDGTYAIDFKNSALIDNNATAAPTTTQQTKKGDHLRLFWDEQVTDATTEAAVEVTISPSVFPGTYRVVGDTFMRSAATGKDEANWLAA